MRITLLLLILAGTSAAAETEIHRCLLEDDTIAFQEKPCSEPARKNDDSKPEETAPTQPETAPSEPVSQDRAECAKITRDAIDAIDLEMRTSTYTRDEGRAYLVELRELTQQLRACKQL